MKSSINCVIINITLKMKRFEETRYECSKKKEGSFSFNRDIG